MGNKCLVNFFPLIYAAEHSVNEMLPWARVFEIFVQVMTPWLFPVPLAVVRHHAVPTVPTGWEAEALSEVLELVLGRGLVGAVRVVSWTVRSMTLGETIRVVGESNRAGALQHRHPVVQEPGRLSPLFNHPRGGIGSSLEGACS